MTKETIEKLKEKLGHGDQGKIARFSGVSKMTVNRFYNGKDAEITDEIKSKIVRATLELIKGRQRAQKEIIRKTNQILN